MVDPVTATTTQEGYAFIMSQTSCPPSYSVPDVFKTLEPIEKVKFFEFNALVCLRVSILNADWDSYQKDLKSAYLFYMPASSTLNPFNGEKDYSNYNTPARKLIDEAYSIASYKGDVPSREYSFETLNNQVLPGIETQIEILGNDLKKYIAGPEMTVKAELRNVRSSAIDAALKALKSIGTLEHVKLTDAEQKFVTKIQADRLEAEGVVEQRSGPAPRVTKQGFADILKKNKLLKWSLIGGGGYLAWRMFT